MQLALDGISKKVGAQTWLYDMSLALQSNAVTVLLGATQAGKTSLMRVMAGLDVPTHGRVLVDGKDVTGTPVRDRNVAMVYQQFINYPSMKVFDNIASPLKLRGEKNIDARVRELSLTCNKVEISDRRGDGAFETVKQKKTNVLRVNLDPIRTKKNKNEQVRK